ncbi:MAG: NAD(P)H-dependent oxidoreductase [Oscillospiraceae bacterium]|nr:NAD(P)H-dependent oxidoreductase [Oscillospiraceae bacterium]
MKNIFIVYCHPSHNSFTYKVREAFIEGLKNASHSYEISDLYDMNFNPVFSEEEYLREAFYCEEKTVPEDVLKEQEKINKADAVVFIYPDFWTASPAMLEGWFQRILTYGYAYGENARMKPIKKAVFLITMGGSMSDKIRREQLEAMETIMIGDRLRSRAEECEVHVFDEMTRGYSNDKHREEKAVIYLKKARKLAENI